MNKNEIMKEIDYNKIEYIYYVAYWKSKGIIKLKKDVNFRSLGVHGAFINMDTNEPNKLYKYESNRIFHKIYNVNWTFTLEDAIEVVEKYRQYEIDLLKKRIKKWEKLDITINAL